jgi:hypothetical protein
MPVIRYIATRSLEAGTTFNDERTIENRFHARPRQTQFSGERRVTLDQSPESYLHGIIRRYDITTDFISANELPQWREFLDSVINTEVFEIDFTGTVAAPGPILDVWLESESLPENEMGGPIRQFRFTVRELP